ncbi:SRPBCC family protein [Mucilaginibacter sp.]|uniref:SRPBCC family protein n=1 Tax=Mucilaginibacter sp. TaxID=1882438 RepID=UPI003B00AFB4
MTVIESKVLIDAPEASVYNFLDDLNNHQQLMPENIIGWTSTRDEARFQIQNMAKLVLKVSSRNPDEILINAIENPPFPLELKWALKEASAQTEVMFTISADMNMMMKMLAKTPLQKLADHETARLKELVN